MRSRFDALIACFCVVTPLAFSGTAFGQDEAPAEPEGLLPIPDYTGGLMDRARLSGDWGGSRTNLAKKGVQLDLSWTQIAQGVVSGGRRIDWDYQGSVDAGIMLDLHRMKLIPGGLLRSRVESRYGESINDDTGTLLAANTDGFFPITSPNNESVVTITELNYTQFLGPKFGLMLGKFQTLDGDPNEFASGRGRSQFMNFQFNATGAAALTIPYSTVGGGAVFLPTDRITISSLVVATDDSSTSSGFEDLDDGLSWITEVDFQYRLGKLPGGSNLGFAYAFDGNFVDLGGKFQTEPLVLPAEDNSWCIFASAWQYIYAMDEAPDKIDLANGTQDVRGIGLFSRLGFADDDTNPVSWTLSGGLGGKGLIPQRERDTCGIAYVYTDFQQAERFEPLGLQGSASVMETYYNIAVTNSVGLTFDVQWLDSVFGNVDDAWLLGARLDVRF